MEHKIFARHPIGNPRRVWRQEQFLTTVASGGIMNLEPKDAEMLAKSRVSVKTCIDAGFDFIGCLWADTDTAMTIVNTAEELGGNVLYQELQRFGGMGDKRIFCPTNDYVGAIADTAKFKSVKGYILWDEPILEEHLAEVRRMLDYCEQVRPDVLPYTVANPDYHRLCRWENNAYVPYIERYLDVLDPAQMSFDYYPVGKKEYDADLQLDNSTMWSCLEIVRRAAAKRDIPFWFYYQAQFFPWHNMEYTFHFDMARAMAFAGVLHGAKATECYTEFDGFVNPATGGPGEYFEEQRRLNADLHTFGNTLMALTCERVIHDDTLLPNHPTMEGYRTDMAESKLLCGSLPKRISVSEHHDAYGHRYLMVLNRDWNESAEISLQLKQASHLYEVSMKDGKQYALAQDADALAVTLAPGDLGVYRIQPAAETPYTLEYILEA